MLQLDEASNDENTLSIDCCHIQTEPSMFCQIIDQNIIEKALYLYT